MLACALGEVANAALGNAILEVGVYATEGKLLVGVIACLFEGIVGELPVVTVIVLDLNAVLGGKGLKGVFGSDGFNQRVINLRVEVSQATVVVDEDGSAAIALSLPLSCATNPSSVNVIWSTETRSPGLVATKTL